MPNLELQELHTIEQIIMSIDNNTMDWSVQYIEQGREEGRVAGLEVGKEKLLKLISQLLTRKFGPLPYDLKTKLKGADISTLDNISEAILDLNSLSELEDLLRCVTKQAFDVIHLRVTRKRGHYVMFKVELRNCLYQF